MEFRHLSRSGTWSTPHESGNAESFSFFPSQHASFSPCIITFFSLTVCLSLLHIACASLFLTAYSPFFPKKMYLFFSQNLYTSLSLTICLSLIACTSLNFAYYLTLFFTQPVLLCPSHSVSLEVGKGGSCTHNWGSPMLISHYLFLHLVGRRAGVVRPDSKCGFLKFTAKNKREYWCASWT